MRQIYFILLQAHIRIWHGGTLSTYSVVGVGVFSNGIISIGFSADVRLTNMHVINFLKNIYSKNLKIRTQIFQNTRLFQIIFGHYGFTVL